MRQTAIDFFTGKRLSLEGVITTPDSPGTATPGVVICHPHPALGGDMDNPVVASIARTAHREGIACLRFNFRGTGRSQGVFSNGPEEEKDLRSAFEFLKVFPGIDPKRLALVGYSFGASAVLKGMGRCKNARSMVLIAPPISAVKQSRIKNDKRPKLFLVGGRDRVVPSTELQRALDNVRPPVQFAEIPGADHSLVGHEQAVAQTVTEFLVQTLCG